MRGTFTLLNPHNYNPETHLEAWIKKALKYYRQVVKFSPSYITLELTDAESLIVKIQDKDSFHVRKNEYYTEADFWTPEMEWAYRWVFTPF